MKIFFSKYFVDRLGFDLKKINFYKAVKMKTPTCANNHNICLLVKRFPNS